MKFTENANSRYGGQCLEAFIWWLDEDELHDLDDFDVNTADVRAAATLVLEANLNTCDGYGHWATIKHFPERERTRCIQEFSTYPDALLDEEC
jgi:hypothetical protein